MSSTCEPPTTLLPSSFLLLLPPLPPHCCPLPTHTALQTGTIKGAGLDVFAVEPLPQDSPLWTLPNVYLTPHSTARTTRFVHDNVDLFLDNLGRYIAGQELLHVVDKSLGY